MKGKRKMSTTLRPNISPDNKYWISKHRYYELKHFCLQYPEWKSAYEAMGTDSFTSYYVKVRKDERSHADPTATLAMKRAELDRKIKDVERCAFDSDPEIADYILQGVTTGASYKYLSAALGMPASKDMYYDRYRKFFWLLNSVRG